MRATTAPRLLINSEEEETVTNSLIALSIELLHWGLWGLSNLEQFEIAPDFTLCEVTVADSCVYM